MVGRLGRRWAVQRASQASLQAGRRSRIALDIALDAAGRGQTLVAR
jgi:hypothetical protein